MRGVFLHVLGDALGSVVVIISALLIWFVEDDWKYYMDPAMRYCLYFKEIISL
jgi:zinc transporter 1